MAIVRCHSMQQVWTQYGFSKVSLPVRSQHGFSKVSYHAVGMVFILNRFLITMPYPLKQHANIRKSHNIISLCVFLFSLSICFFLYFSRSLSLTHSPIHPPTNTLTHTHSRLLTPYVVSTLSLRTPAGPRLFCVYSRSRRRIGRCGWARNNLEQYGIVWYSKVQ